MIILDTNVISEAMRLSPSPAVLGWLRSTPVFELATTTINPNNNPSASTSQASSFATDDRREDDLAYFAARPDVTMRIRGPLPGESKFLRSVSHTSLQLEY